MRGKPLETVRTEEGCIVSTSHKLNHDGYLRVRDYRYTGKGRKPLIMIHRLVYEENFGEIPEGFEVHHKCHNRACFNPEHLEIVPIPDHKVTHNSTRYIERKNKAHEYWSEAGCSGTELAEVFEVSVSSACKWIREWKRRDYP